MKNRAPLMLKHRNVFTPAIGELNLFDQGHLFFYLQQYPTTEKSLKAGEYSYTKDGSLYQFELKHDVMFLGTIDPKVVNLSHEIIWKHLLHKNYSGRFFLRGVHVITMRDNDNRVTAYLQFVTPISLGVRKSRDEKIVCDLIDQRKHIADGGFSRVVEITGTIKHRYDDNAGLRLEPGNEKRIAKIGRFEPSYEMDIETELTKEFKLSQQCQHLGIRAPMFGLTYPNEKHGFLSIRRMKEKNLFDVIDHDMEKTITLTSDDRFQLCIAILTALKNQIKSNDITHRDIKTDAIIVEKDHIWVAKFIDLNLAKLRCSGDKYACGSGHYIAPETLDLDSGDASELFSTALVLALIWRDKSQYKLSQTLRQDKDDDDIDVTKQHQEIIKMRKLAGWKITFDMFDGLNDLNESTKIEIKAQLTRMTEVSQHKRGTVENAIVVFEKLYLSHKFGHPGAVKAELEPAHAGHEAAVSIRAKLLFYANLKVSEGKTLSQNFAIWLCMQLPPSNQPVLLDHPAAIREFVFALGVRDFFELTTRQSLIDKANQIVNDFYAMHNQLRELHEKFKTTHADMLALNILDLSTQFALFSQCVKLDIFCSHMKKTTLDFSLIANETRHMQEKFNKFNAAYDYFAGLVGFLERPALCSGLGIL
jgi:serine/threonine protein kinase